MPSFAMDTLAAGRQLGLLLLALVMACGCGSGTQQQTPEQFSQTQTGPKSLPPPVTERPEVVVPCETPDHTYYTTCDEYDASPQWPRAAPPHERCAATLRPGVFMVQPPDGTSATFNAEVTRVTCADLACGYGYCALVDTVAFAEALPRPSCAEGGEQPVCIAAPPAGVSEPAPAPFAECPAAIQLIGGGQRLDGKATEEARRTPASSHACCYMQCFSYPG